MPSDATERLPDDSIQTEKGGTVPQEAGLPQKDLSKENYRIDVQARTQISEEMGHERLRITYVYLGR